MITIWHCFEGVIAKVFKEMFGAILEFLEGVGGKNHKNLPWEGYMDIFWHGTKHFNSRIEDTHCISGV